MLKLKVCGLKDSQNIKEIISLKPSMMGFVFHQNSPRNFSENSPICVPDNIETVGVFVDSSVPFVEAMIKQFKLSAIQLYHEDLKPFQHIRRKVKLIKAISIERESDIYKARNYLQDCDLFLFDAKGVNPGGNGIKFDWSFLDLYTDSNPFLLSGGITPEDAPLLRNIQHNKLIGIDINSKFEISPGIKNIRKIEQFKKELHENFEYHR